jgi:hypothetical protein
MRSIFGVITVVAMTGCVPEYFQNFSANGPDEGVLPSSSTLTTQPSGAYTSADSMSEANEASTVPFHGLSCLSAGDLDWSSADLCMGDTDCDLVTFALKSGLVDVFEGDVHLCLARDDSGDWGLCPEVLGIDEGEVWSRMEDAFDYDARYDVEPLPELASCVREADFEPVVDVDEVGIRFTLVGLIDHVACATDQPGEWGGANPLGTVYFPIVDDCVDSLIEDGWTVAYSEISGGHVVMGDSFSLDLVLTGQQADL